MYLYPPYTDVYMWRPAELEHVSGQLRVKEEECAALQEALAREVAAVSTLQALLIHYYTRVLILLYVCPRTTRKVAAVSTLQALLIHYFMCVLVLRARLLPSARCRRYYYNTICVSSYYYMCVLVLRARLLPSARYRRPHCLFKSMRACMS
jgi:hypothetical protein